MYESSSICPSYVFQHTLHRDAVTLPCTAMLLLFTLSDYLEVDENGEGKFQQAQAADLSGSPLSGALTQRLGDLP